MYANVFAYFFANMNDLGRSICLVIHMLEPLQTLSPVQLLGISDDQGIPNFSIHISVLTSTCSVFICVSIIYLSMMMVYSLCSKWDPQCNKQSTEAAFLLGHMHIRCERQAFFYLWILGNSKIIPNSSFLFAAAALLSQNGQIAV